MAYEVFVNGELLYDSALVNDKELQIISPTININEEGGSFSFTFPKNHSLWGKILSGFNGNETHPLFTQKTDIVTVMENNKWLWEGYVSDYQEDFNGNYSVTCDGALSYLKHADLHLEHILNVTRGANEDADVFFRRAFKIFVTKVLKIYNDRLNDLMDTYHIDLNHQKIYLSDNYSKIDIPSNIPVPNHFSRIVNFESCYDALQKRIAEDFGGHFYITKSYAHQLSTAFRPQDSSIRSTVVRDVLLINFKSTHDVLDNTAVYLGEHLLDYNVSESFDLVTSVIPRGASASDDNTEDVRWWFKDKRSAFHDIEQYANYGYAKGKYEYHSDTDFRLTEYGEFSVSLPYSESNQELVKKYGLNEVIVDFGDDVVAKFPERNGEIDNQTYGYPYNDSNKWHYRSYNVGDVIWVDMKEPATNNKLIYAYCARAAHVATDASRPPDYDGRTPGPFFNKFWEQMGLCGRNSINNPAGETDYGYMDFITSWPNYNARHGLSSNDDGWLTIDDYLNAPNEWRTDTDGFICDTWYIEDYTRALRILALDYLQNQQFNELELSISCDMVVLDKIRTETTLSYTTDLAIYYMHIGDQIPVSADLFGSNLKPYQITEVSIKLDNPSESTMTLGGKTTDLSALVRNKQS